MGLFLDRLQQVVMVDGRTLKVGLFTQHPDGSKQESIKGSQGWQSSTSGESLLYLGLVECKKRYFHNVQTESLVYSFS